MPDDENPARRAWLLSMLAAFAVVVAGTSPLWAAQGDRTASGLSSVEPSPASPSPVSPAATAATAAALARDHWRALPPAPIEPRPNPAIAWTGSQLIVWGGGSKTPHGDGAAYDPATRTWSTLPPAPISARTDMGYVWTGSALLIWGGYAGDSGGNDTGNGRYLSDGAIYTPGTKTWRKLPASHLTPRINPQLIWTDRQVFVLGGDPRDSTLSGPGYAHGMAAYDPVKNRWRMLPAMPTSPHHEVRHLRAVTTSRGIYVWQLWQHVTTTSDGESLAAGMDLAVYGPDRDSWSLNPGGATGFAYHRDPVDVDQLVVGGDRVYAPATQPWWGDGSLAPPVQGEVGHTFDLASSTWSALPAGPFDSLGPVGVWTGAALLEYDARVAMSTNGGPTTGPGASAAYDPASRKWTPLPTAPLGGGDPAVWTGSTLLTWGRHGQRFGP